MNLVSIESKAENDFLRGKQELWAKEEENPRGRPRGWWTSLETVGETTLPAKKTRWSWAGKTDESWETFSSEGRFGNMKRIFLDKGIWMYLMDSGYMKCYYFFASGEDIIFSFDPTPPASTDLTQELKYYFHMENIEKNYIGCHCHMRNNRTLTLDKSHWEYILECEAGFYEAYSC